MSHFDGKYIRCKVTHKFPEFKHVFKKDEWFPLEEEPNSGSVSVVNNNRRFNLSTLQFDFTDIRDEPPLKLEDILERKLEWMEYKRGEYGSVSVTVSCEVHQAISMQKHRELPSGNKAITKQELFDTFVSLTQATLLPEDV